MMENLGIDFEFFDAVDGSQLEVLDRSIYSPALARKIHGRPLSPGEIGCALSHIYVWQAFLESNASELLVLEDDAEIGVALIEILKHRVSFPDDWEIINFVSDTGVDVTDGRLWDIYRVSVFRGHSNRTACYLINRKGAQRLLNKAFPLRFTADGITGRASETGLVMYGVWPPVAGLSGESTTIDDRKRVRKIAQLARSFFTSLLRPQP